MAGHQRNISSLIWWPVIVTYLIVLLYKKIYIKSQSTNTKGGWLPGQKYARFTVKNQFVSA